MKTAALLCLLFALIACANAQAYIRFHNAYTATNQVGVILNTDATFLPRLGQKQSTQYIPMCTGTAFAWELTGLAGTATSTGTIGALADGEVLDFIIRGTDGSSNANDAATIIQVEVNSQGVNGPEFLQDTTGKNQAAVRVINAMLSANPINVDVRTTAGDTIATNQGLTPGATIATAGYVMVDPNTDVNVTRTSNAVALPVTPNSGNADDLVFNRHYTVIIFGENNGAGGEVPLARIVHDSYPVVVGSANDRETNWANLRVAHLNKDRSGSNVQISVNVDNTAATGTKASCTWTTYDNSNNTLYNTDVDEPIASGRTLIRGINNAAGAFENGISTISLYGSGSFVGAATFGDASPYANVTSGVYSVVVRNGTANPTGLALRTVNDVRVESGEGLTVFAYGGNANSVLTVQVEDLAQFNGSYCPQGTPAPTTASPTTSPTTGTPVTPSPTQSPTTGTPVTPSPTFSPTTGTPVTPSPTFSPTTGTPVTPSPTQSPVTASPTFAKNGQAFVVAPFAPYGYVSHAIRIPKTAQLTITYSTISSTGAVSSTQSQTVECVTPPTPAPTTVAPTNSVTPGTPTTPSPTPDNSGFAAQPVAILVALCAALAFFF